MADIINEGDSKVEVIDSGAAGDAQITAVLNNVERASVQIPQQRIMFQMQQSMTGHVLIHPHKHMISHYKEF